MARGNEKDEKRETEEIKGKERKIETWELVGNRASGSCENWRGRLVQKSETQNYKHSRKGPIEVGEEAEEEEEKEEVEEEEEDEEEDEEKSSQME